MQVYRSKTRMMASGLVSLLLLFLTSTVAMAIEPAVGRVLVASSSLYDPNFSQTVVLITHYSKNEAAGLIINRPSSYPVSTALPGIQSRIGEDPAVYLGGPVSMQTIRVLVDARTEVKHGYNITDNVYYLDDQASLGHVLSHPESIKAYRFFAGYAGWGPGQLEIEIQRGAWHVFSANPVTFFEPHPERLWPLLIQRVTGTWALK